MASSLEDETLRRVSWRLLPLLFVLYVGNYLDRTNVSLAALEMNRDIGLSTAAYGLGSGMFFIGYALFELPSNLILARVGARRWMARIAITWGLLACAMMFVRGARSFYVIRFLLGFAEAGFFPGIIYYLSSWFPQRLRARAISRFMVGVPLSSFIGGPIASALLSLRGRSGLAGWQWLFLIEGIPSVILGIIVFVYLTDRPSDATWLRAEQREWLIRELEREYAARADTTEHDFRRAIGRPSMWLLTAIYLLGLCAWLGAVYFAPIVVRDVGGFATTSVGWIIGGFGAAGIIGMLINGAHSDSTDERVWHTSVPMVIVAAGMLVAAAPPRPSWVLVGFALIYFGSNAFLPVFWCVPSALMRGTAAAGGIAIINSVGNLGGFFAPTMLGSLKVRTGTFTSGLAVLSACALLSALLMLRFRGDMSRR